MRFYEIVQVVFVTEIQMHIYSSSFKSVGGFKVTRIVVPCRYDISEYYNSLCDIWNFHHHNSDALTTCKKYLDR